MSKNANSQFVCSNCGASFASWFGKCPECGEWGSLTLFKDQTGGTSSSSFLVTSVTPSQFIPLKKTKAKKDLRLHSGFQELDRVLGGGFVQDEVILLSGEPGIGKSTLLLSILGHMASLSQVVYVSGEESGAQIEERARRLGVKSEQVFFSEEKNIGNILAGLDNLLTRQKVSVVIFDSLQVFYASEIPSLPGSVSQSKEVLTRIVGWAKKNQILSLIVGHITKDGEIAGPKFLEHLVDCVLFMEGEKMTSLRLVRSFKNRYGSVDEVGFFEMTKKGMNEVENPSRYFLDLTDESVGKANVGTHQGKRIIFATCESLLVPTSLSFPRRVAKGLDSKRLELILAILKKYLHALVDSFDVYVNISGGLRIDDPLADLGIAAAIYSSLSGKKVAAKSLFLGEVGLLGKIRQSGNLAVLEKEAKRIGFQKIYSSQNFTQIELLKNILV